MSENEKKKLLEIKDLKSIIPSRASATRRANPRTSRR